MTQVNGIYDHSPSSDMYSIMSLSPINLLNIGLSWAQSSRTIRMLVKVVVVDEGDIVEHKGAPHFQEEKKRDRGVYGKGDIAPC